mmetsp:Transcript_5653/g.12562  ORF Transcript_5653/g.12562 Transcript_5653/m.12562 type:complete len:89 (+) Transcript_5653:543-809(+)
MATIAMGKSRKDCTCRWKSMVVSTNMIRLGKSENDDDDDALFLLERDIHHVTSRDSFRKQSLGDFRNCLLVVEAASSGLALDIFYPQQ